MNKLDTTEANQELQSINDENQQLQQKLATMLQMSNAKDWQIAQLEYKLRSQLMMLSSQNDYQKSSKGIYTLCCISHNSHCILELINYTT